MRTAVDIECVNVVIPRAEVEDAVDEQRRRLHGAGGVAPQDLAAMEQIPATAAEEDGDDEPRLRAREAAARIRLHVGLVDDVRADRRRGGAAMVEVLAPLPFPRRGVDDEEPP